MSTSSTRNLSSSGRVIDTAPLLYSAANRENDRGQRNHRRESLRDAARYLRRASSRRLMREPSMLVRETAAEQLEERQSDWAYSKPIVVLDLIWNFAFVVVTAGVLLRSWRESSTMPLRLWVVVYAVQCLVHMVCVFVEFTRRGRRLAAVEEIDSVESSRPGLRGDVPRYVSLARVRDYPSPSVAKHFESANTMFSFIWWTIGFYWVSGGGPALARESPQLYWLCVIFLAFDVFFVLFCVALACVIGIAVCCCLPCIIAILYAVADQEGATAEDLEQLTKFKFKKFGDGEEQGTVAGVMTECGTDTPIEHSLLQEDAECCICLTTYDDGAELRQLPCGHHFHCTCVGKWLFINATCPLCKYDILGTDNYGIEQV